jgi:elongation factor P--beta-lysine ligase
LLLTDPTQPSSALGFDRLVMVPTAVGDIEHVLWAPVR